MRQSSRCPIVRVADSFSRPEQEILQGGVIDSAHQPLALMLMAFGPQDVSRLRVGSLSAPAMSLMRNLCAFVGLKFQIWPEADDHSTVVACRGVGFSNSAKSSF